MLCLFTMTIAVPKISKEKHDMKRFKMTSACKHVPKCQSAALSRMIMPTSPLTPWLRGCSCCPNLLAQASATWGFAYAAQLSVMIVYKWCFLKAVVPVAHLIKKLIESPMLGWRLVASLAGWLAGPFVGFLMISWRSEASRFGRWQRQLL